MTQADALAILKTGANVFLTGEPGSGKSHTVNAYVEYLRGRGIEPSITASTGIAATHIHGMTIHSWSGIGITEYLTPEDLDRIASREHVVKRVRPAKVLIIDEISMLSASTLSMVEAVCREIRQMSDAFGGLQVVLVGDFFQLPPIVRKSFRQDSQDSFYSDLPEGEGEGIFAFTSDAWRRANPIVCYLTEQHRQDDPTFLEVLSSVRRNEVTAEHRAHIDKRKISMDTLPQGITKLFSHNADVDRINAEALAKLPGTPRTYKMSSRGRDSLVENLKRGCLSPEVLALKEGASVMFTKNNVQGRFVNGTLGTVVSFTPGMGYPEVRTLDGALIAAEPLDWSVEENGVPLATVSQIPLRLAWAMTVHKSQGMSMDAAVMDLSASFEYGQGYVALSRVRRLSGLHLLGINKKALEVHPQILEKDAEFREQSETAENTFTSLSKSELQKLHTNFIRACGGSETVLPTYKKIAKAKKGKKEPSAAYAEKIAKLREKHPRAYTPWTEADDAALKDAFMKEKRIEKLSARFGRQPGSIKARLIQFGLVKDDYVPRP
jgi:hypothetical protein